MMDARVLAMNVIRYIRVKFLSQERQFTNFLACARSSML